MRGSDVGSWLQRSDKTEGARQCAVCAGPGPGKPSSHLSADSCQADCCCSPQVEIVVGAAVILLASRAQHPAPWDSTTPLQSIFADLWGGGCMTSSSEPQVLETLHFLICHVTNSTQFNNCFKRFFFT